jgi:hypothetical protein
VRWSVRVGNSDVLELSVPDTFMEWLRPRVRDHVLRGLDPYGDAILDKTQVESVRVELQRIGREWREEIASALTRSRRLPTDLVTRDAMLREWVDRELARTPFAGLLNDVIAALVLACESGAILRIRGD